MDNITLEKEARIAISELESSIAVSRKLLEGELTYQEEAYLIKRLERKNQPLKKVFSLKLVSSLDSSTR